MKHWAIILAVVCAACPRPSSTPQGTTTAPSTATAMTTGAVQPEGSAGCPAPPTTDAKSAARRRELMVEIERFDRELDAIDGELAAAAQSNGRTLVQARVDALAYKALLDAMNADLPAVTAGTPRMLARAVRELQRALVEKAQLDTELGPEHPNMKLVVRRIEHLRRTITVQLDAERAFAQTWIDLLAALPAKAKPEKIYKARLRALHATIAKAPSSDSPAAVQMAVERLNDLMWTHAALVDVVGPKHPGLVVVTAQLDEATKAKAASLAAADAELAARISAPTRLPNNAVITRRSELADAAREMRREYELLLEQ